jgi:hypothetical protein
MAKLTSPKVSKRISYDSMSISGKMPSGASLKWSINRNGERLEVAFSNDTNVLKTQLQVVQKWIEYRAGESNQSRFDRMETLLKTCNSGSDVITKMQAELSSVK